MLAHTAVFSRQMHFCKPDLFHLICCGKGGKGNLFSAKSKSVNSKKYVAANRKQMFICCMNIQEYSALTHENQVFFPKANTHKCASEKHYPSRNKEKSPFKEILKE